MRRFIPLLLLYLAGSVLGQTPIIDAKDFTIKDIDGKSYTLFTLLGQNKYVMVECWASW